MPHYHIATPDEIEEIRRDAEESDHDVEAILDRYVTPDEAVGLVVELHKAGWFSPKMCEVVDVDTDDSTVRLEGLFDPETTHQLPFDAPLPVPFIGQEYTVSWLEARIDDDWQRVSDVRHPGQWRKARTDSDEYDNVRRVEKTYTHGTDQYREWPVRIDRQTGEPSVSFDRSDLQNPEALTTALNQVELPDNFSLNGLVIGQVYTDEHIVTTDDGHRERVYELVWYSIKPQFRPNGRRYTTAVNGVDHSGTCI